MWKNVNMYYFLILSGVGTLKSISEQIDFFQLGKKGKVIRALQLIFGLPITATIWCNFMYMIEISRSTLISDIPPGSRPCVIFD